jgi:hypothetical protein
VDTAPTTDRSPFRRRVARVCLAIAASIALVSAAALGGHKFYVDQYLPSREMNALGVTEIGVWSDRKIARDYRPDGSTATFTFSISDKVEARLRERCMPNDNEALTTGICTFALRAQNRETVWADVGPNEIRLHQVKVVVPPSNTSLERTRER